MCELFCPDLNLLFNSLRTTMTSGRTKGCHRRQLAAHLTCSIVVSTNDNFEKKGPVLARSQQPFARQQLKESMKEGDGDTI